MNPIVKKTILETRALLFLLVGRLLVLLVVLLGFAGKREALLSPWEQLFWSLNSLEFQLLYLIVYRLNRHFLQSHPV